MRIGDIESPTCSSPCNSLLSGCFKSSTFLSGSSAYTLLGIAMRPTSLARQRKGLDGASSRCSTTKSLEASNLSSQNIGCIEKYSYWCTPLSLVDLTRPVLWS